MEDRFVPATTTLRVRAPLQAQVGQGAGTAVLTMNLIAGENITLTFDEATEATTIAASGGGGGGGLTEAQVRARVSIGW
jgi:hypothetical protein